jgi:hypothetical protein
MLSPKTLKRLGVGLKYPLSFIFLDLCMVLLTCVCSLTSCVCQVSVWVWVATLQYHFFSPCLKNL